MCIKNDLEYEDALNNLCNVLNFYTGEQNELDKIDELNYAIMEYERNPCPMGQTKFKIRKIEEAGYHSAVLGVSLSYGTSFVKATNTVLKLKTKDLGHNKFLESIQTWWDITAPRYWWCEMDTYRIGTSKQSESTIHTLKREVLTKDNFAGDVPGCIIEYLNNMIEDNRPLEEIKNILPEGFLQRRILNVNYKSLRNMILQRRNHKLKEWHVFCDEVLKQVSYPYLLPIED